jgi:acetyl esterase/lipase
MRKYAWIGFMAAWWCCAGAALATTGTANLLNRQARPWQPAPPSEQIPIWPDGLKIAPPSMPGEEDFGTSTQPLAGLPVTVVEHVSRPTMTIYSPKGNNTGAAVVVFPGGGYRVLAIDLEGTDICDWLTSRGITCVLLKYRVPGSGPYYNEECNCAKQPTVPMALQDAQRTIALLREHAASLGVDPHKIGVVGFSAGGRMVADVSNHTKLSYKPVDNADKQSVRPDFAMALYPGHLWKGPGITLRQDVKIDPHAPPTLIVQAGDDPVDDVRESVTYYVALQQAGVPVEMHLYAHGGHAFGVRSTPNPITQWPTLAEAWMSNLGVLAAPVH